MEITNIDGSHLHLNDAMLDHCAEAMYKIREPIGSTRVPFSAISQGKKITNRRVASEVLQTATLAWSQSSASTDPNSIFDLVGDDLYRRMAPNKSQLNPWDGRSDFAKDYYRAKARTYLYAVLNPYASDSPSSYQVSAPRSRDALARNQDVESIHFGSGRSKALPTSERVRDQSSDQAGRSDVHGLPQGAIRNGVPEAKVVPTRTNPSTPDPTGARLTIALLMIVIVLLLVFILIALVR